MDVKKMTRFDALPAKLMDVESDLHEKLYASTRTRKFLGHLLAKS